MDHGKDDAKFREDLMNIAKTTLSSKILVHQKDHFAKLAVDAVLRLKVLCLHSLPSTTFCTNPFNHIKLNHSVFSRELINQLNRFKKSTRANGRSSANRSSTSIKCIVKQIFLDAHLKTRY